MVSIVDTSLRHTIWETIYDTLTSAHLGTSLVTVTSSYIDNTPTFPQVVVNPIKKSESEKTIGDNPTYLKDIAIVIDVFTKKNEQIDTICDEIDTLLKSTTINGIYLVNMDSAPGEGRDANNTKIHACSLTFNYKRRS